MKNKKFSIIEMMVVICIMAMLMALALPYLERAKKTKLKVTTRNMLNQHKAMISAYYTDYGVLPDPGNINYDRPAPFINYNDSTPTPYWRRASSTLRPLNDITVNNAELIFDRLDNEENGSIETISEFKLKFPLTKIKVKLEPWQVNLSIPFFKKEQEEEVRVITHSSRFLNYYLSGSGFDVQKESYVKNDDKWLANYDTSFRLSFERSVKVDPFLFVETDELITYDGGYSSGWGGTYTTGKELKMSSIPPVNSYNLNKSISTYFGYLPKVITVGNAQKLSQNYDEDLKRRLYDYGDSKVVQLKDAYDPKKVTLGSDRMIFNSTYFGYSELNDVAGGDISKKRDALDAAKKKLVDDTAAGAPQATLDADQAAIDTAQATVTLAEQALKKTVTGNLKNVNACIFMRAHNDNVKEIVDAFNSPIVYVTYMNQRLDSARTYKDPDPSKDKSLRSDSFILYSLGENKADDSNLGENYFSQGKTGDDIIEMSGGK